MGAIAFNRILNRAGPADKSKGAARFKDTPKPLTYISSQRVGSRMARATPLQKPDGISQTMRSGRRPPLQIHSEAGDPAAVVEWRGRPRFKNPMGLFKNVLWKPTAASPIMEPVTPASADQ